MERAPGGQIVGTRRRQKPRRVEFTGSIKWRERSPFDKHDLGDLLSQSRAVPGADASALTVGVSRAGFGTGGLDVEVGPDQLLEAWE